MAMGYGAKTLGNGSFRAYPNLCVDIATCAQNQKIALPGMVNPECYIVMTRPFRMWMCNGAEPSWRMHHYRVVKV
jgi:hypothetical protein